MISRSKITLVLVTGSTALAACGGTTGQPAVIVMDASVDVSVPDASANDVFDTGAFDVTLLYADAARLSGYEASSPSSSDSSVAVNEGDSGSGGDGAPGDNGEADVQVEAAPPVWDTWPTCACDTLDDLANTVVDDSGTCSTATYTQNASCDYGIRYEGPACDTQAGYTEFPPCCGFRDAGFPGANAVDPTHDKFFLCGQLFTCIFGPDAGFYAPLAAGHYGTDNIYYPYCGDRPDGAVGVGGTWCFQDNQAQGGCKPQIEAAFETTDPKTIQAGWGKAIPVNQVGSVGGVVTALFYCVWQAKDLTSTKGLAACFEPPIDAGDDGGDGGGDDGGDATTDP